MSIPSRHTEPKEGEPRYRTRYDVLEDVSVSMAVAKAATAAAGGDEFVLYDYVDPDALDQLFEHGIDSTNWELTFEADEFLVTVDSDGWITVF